MTRRRRGAVVGRAPQAPAQEGNELQGYFSRPVNISWPMTVHRDNDPEGKAIMVGYYAKKRAEEGMATGLAKKAVYAAKKKYHMDKAGLYASVAGGGLAATSAAVGVTATGVSLVFPPAAPIVAVVSFGVCGAIAVGSYTLKRVVAFVADQRRGNRDWIANCDAARRQTFRDWEFALSSEASDAIRRAAQHFRRAERCLNEKVKPEFTGAVKINTCEDMIRKVGAMAEFIHESDKTRNYLLPIFDIIIMTLIDYINISKVWEAESVIYDNAVIRWLYVGNHTNCSELKKHSSNAMCFAREKMHGASFSPQPRNNLVNIKDALNLATEFARELESALKGHGDVKKNAAKAAAMVEGRGSEKRKNLLYEAMYRRFDQLSFFNKARHRARNAWERSTAKEKVLRSIGEIGDMIGLGAGVVGGAIGASGSEALAAKAIKGSLWVLGKGATAASLSPLIVGPAISPSLSKDGKTWMLESFVMREKSENLKNEGKAAEDLIKDMAEFYQTAVKRHEELRAYVGSEIRLNSCDDCLTLYHKVYRFLNYMDKVEDNLICLLGVAMVLAERSLLWSNFEARAWDELDNAVEQWIKNPLVHDACRAANTVCYGAKKKQHTSHTGRFFNRQKVAHDDGFDHWTPEKPL